MIEPYGPPTTEQLTARYLARCGTPMTSDSLEHALTGSGYCLDAGELIQAIATHPAFTELDDGAYGIGMPVSRGPHAASCDRPETI